ncbi:MULTISPECIES: serine/threonine protein kinase [Rhodococcus]|uniref:serine/threonine protein kinase n=1 Tax=Rhodococcus TaxID=1827 RepID=UPI002954544D|nr:MULTISPECIES: serine/threonine protein kinase [Rhodococcus]MDV7246749.1 serine/threonine protein kinase [Rhodococcus oxybenzonivorans]MDV7337762.1 serine/threonine protein kinase [Rhodococcus oxybenzonivorans]MDV7347818.1 serine/threonine protein kinase [Rhodococcus oxybenzonivorans]MDV8031526.1 serine/threonine protein kinase [Rhodococcus sp. IEGM 27]
MRRPRWPEIAPPSCGGVRVHGRRLLAADTHLTVELVQVVAFASGLGVHVALTATGRAAELAQYQTRPLTDPADESGRWSYLEVRAGIERTVFADPFLPTPDVQGCAGGLCTYRTEPRYWLGERPPVRALTITAQWRQIGLPHTMAVVALASIDEVSPTTLA